MSDPKTWWWMSFYVTVPLPSFEYHGPWWVSGYGAYDEPTVCMAVVADSEDAAREIARCSYDEGKRPKSLRMRFCEQRSGSPFGDRFSRATWMRWPWPLLKKAPTP